MRAEPLCDSLNPLFCVVFAAVAVCARSVLLWSIKSHDGDLSVFCLLQYICDLNLEVTEKFQRTIIVFHTRNKTVPFAHGNFPWKFALELLVEW